MQDLGLYRFDGLGELFWRGRAVIHPGNLVLVIAYHAGRYFDTRVALVFILGTGLRWCSANDLEGFLVDWSPP